MDAVAIEVGPPGEIEPDTLALPFASDDSGLPSNGARQLDERLEARLRRLADQGELKGTLGETVLLHTDGESNVRRVVVAGVGKRDEVDADALRTAASAVVRRGARNRGAGGGGVRRPPPPALPGTGRRAPRRDPPRARPPPGAGAR